MRHNRRWFRIIVAYFERPAHVNGPRKVWEKTAERRDSRKNCERGNIPNFHFPLRNLNELCNALPVEMLSLPCLSCSISLPRASRGCCIYCLSLSESWNFSCFHAERSIVPLNLMAASSRFSSNGPPSQVYFAHRTQTSYLVHHLAASSNFIYLNIYFFNIGQ